MRVAAFEAVDQLADGALLVAREHEVRDEVEAVVEGGHTNLQSYYG